MKKSFASLSKSLLAGVAAAVLTGLSALPAKADKGMWIIQELQKENIQRMKELGLKIDPTKMFDLENPGIANAVVIFGGGCTGVTVSNSGLIFTNHHCGYDAIQSQSTVEHDYLQDGFISKSHAEELPIPGLKVRYLRETVDVTEQIEKATMGISNEMDRIQAIAEEMEKISTEYAKGKDNIDVDVYPFYEFNKFYLIVYDVFSDVRLVFAPPSSVGKFGHDTDNWMWPRHTNDFSVFRVYANKDNQAAAYAPENRPYVPRTFVPVSLAGVKDKDYTMTIGFPGSTDRYLSSWGVENRINNTNEPTILVRGIKQDIWSKYMKDSQAIRIQYAAKYAQSSNYWKNFIGMNKGLRRLNVIDSKRALESQFAEWESKDPARQAEYGAVLDSLKYAIEGAGAIEHDLTILMEALSGTELRGLIALPKDIKSFDADKVYKNFSPIVGRATLPAMLKAIKENVQPKYLPEIFSKIDTEFGGDLEKYADYLYANSVFVSKDRLLEALKNLDALRAAYEQDPAVELVKSISIAAMTASNDAMPYEGANYKGRRLFFKGLKEMMPDTPLPSNANFTMRLSYGSVGGYKPYDAAWYDYYTTQQGVFEKQDPESDEFRVQPEILKLLADKSSYGQYADPADGNLHVAFLSNNDITGGNSGSPVFNGNGELIGLAFDGNWEAMSGDIEFEPNLQRTISVDIRYVLYFIDVWGGADHIIKELTLVK